MPFMQTHRSLNLFLLRYHMVRKHQALKGLTLVLDIRSVCVHTGGRGGTGRMVSQWGTSVTKSPLNRLRLAPLWLIWVPLELT